MAAAATFASIATTVGNTISQRDAILAQGSVEASRARSAARVAKFQAADAIERGDKEASKVRGAQTQLTGTQRAILASQGIDPNSGSGAAAVIESRFFGDLDIIETKNNARLEAFGFKAQALTSEGRARFAKLSSKAAAKQTLLTGAGQVANSIAFYSSSKIPSRSRRFTPRNKTEKKFNDAYKKNRENR